MRDYGVGGTEAAATTRRSAMKRKGRNGCALEGLVAPVVVGCGYSLEVDGHHLGCCGEAVGGIGVFRSQFVQDFRIGLGVFHASSAEGDRQFETFLRGGCDEGCEPELGHWVHLLSGGACSIAGEDRR